MAYQYQFARYSFQDTARITAAQASMDAYGADGWRMHTALPNGHELGVVWERAVADDTAPVPPTPKRARRGDDKEHGGESG